MPNPTPPFSPAPDTPSSVEPVPAASVAPRAHPKFGVVNLILVLGSVLVFLLSSFGDDQKPLLPLFISLFPAHSPNALIEVRNGEVWRLFTPAFIHFNFAHIGFNMLGMKNIGDPMERVHGPRFYLLLTAVLALISNLGQYYVSGSPGFGGMSGVLYGLFGYLWLRALVDRTYPLRMPTQTIVVALIWFVVCFTGKLGPIANGAHTLGLLLGAAWGLAAGLRARERGTQSS